MTLADEFFDYFSVNESANPLREAALKIGDAENEELEESGEMELEQVTSSEPEEN